MRNFEERKAEIFRRSEERILKRKQTRNRIFMGCVPLVLLVFIISFNYLPQTLPASPYSTASDNSENTTTAVTSVKVKSSDDNIDNYLIHTDTTAVNEVINVIDSIAANGGIAMDRIETTESAKTYDAVASQARVSTYTIIITDRNGEITTYTLYPMTLINTQTDEIFELTEEQNAALRTALGIVQE